MKAIVTGVSGQDGSWMADYLIENTDVEVYGVVRRLSVPNHKNIEHLVGNPRFHLVSGDISDAQSIDGLVRDIMPDYFINFAAQSFVGVSWDMPEHTFDVGAVAVLRCLESIRRNAPKCRFYNAGSSEEFGDVKFCPQTMAHPMSPRSPYGAAKVAARMLTKVYRESYNLYAIQGLLFNHESERRGFEFLPQKIAIGVGRIVNAMRDGLPFQPIEVGNILAKRDWSHAKDFVCGVWLMLNQEKPKEYILASGETRSVKEFIDQAFLSAGIGVRWTGEGLHTSLVRAVDGTLLVRINPKFFRPAEVDILQGDASEAEKELGWKREYSFKDLVECMVNNAIKNKL